ncbi:Uncharacterized protein APZ42_033108 [Daphnia magna]|uniref:Uncharacterized protein n=1 Tax=Daphnia magna TaxID=35525 RepID=A0A0P5VNR1_9CRUS|nr:Uncharacterized protein APZ42_033108 [Daphnia magna]
MCRTQAEWSVFRNEGRDGSTSFVKTRKLQPIFHRSSHCDYNGSTTSLTVTYRPSTAITSHKCVLNLQGKKNKCHQTREKHVTQAGWTNLIGV